MAHKEARNTMRFWIITGIAAIVAGQLPLLLRQQSKHAKGKATGQSEQTSASQKPKNKALWRILLLTGGLLFAVAVIVGIILWAAYAVR